MALLLLGLTFDLGYSVEQHEFWKIIGSYATFFLVYLLVAHQSPISNHQSLKFWLLVAIALRLLLVFALPNLSNDVYRFIWDGRLLVQGYNPFDHLPMYYLEHDLGLQGIDRALFEAYDAKNFYTVYPPVAQAQFASACWLFPDSIYGASVVMKLWLFFFEIGSIWLMVKLLRRFQLPEWNVLWYALNPLIIFEITGNLHFEGAMIFFLLLAVWLLTDNHRKAKVGGPILSNHGLRTTNHDTFSAIAFALSISSKLLTILFLPFFIRKMGWGRAMRYFTITGVATVLLFLPIVNASFLSNFGDSLNLYFQKLEFNASLYYLARWVGEWLTGYNQIAVIGPALGLLAMGGILWMAAPPSPPWRGGAGAEKSPSWSQMFQFWLLAICLYLACTTTMHPWYVAMPVALCVFTPWRFPIVWSGMIFLTYVNYSYSPYRENLWVVALEYAVVFGWLAWEWRTHGKKLLTN